MLGHAQTKHVASSFPTNTPNVWHAIVKAQRNMAPKRQESNQEPGGKAVGRKRKACKGEMEVKHTREGTAKPKRKAKVVTEEARLSADGRTVRYKTRPSVKAQERIQRALPGASSCMRRTVERKIEGFRESRPQRNNFSVISHFTACVAGAGSGHRMFLLERKTVAPVGTESGPVEVFDLLGPHQLHY
jgi:hypothetical protein